MLNLRIWFKNASQIAHDVLDVSTLAGIFQAVFVTVLTTFGIHITALQFSQDVGKFSAVILVISKGIDSLNNIFTSRNITPESVLAMVEQAVATAVQGVGAVVNPAPAAVVAPPAAAAPVEAQPAPVELPAPVEPVQPAPQPMPVEVPVAPATPPPLPPPNVPAAV